ncbi:MAG TPA: hypothetical protein PLN85_00440 [archaeon]|nr:hypothetical protein [archaeon]
MKNIKNIVNSIIQEYLNEQESKQHDFFKKDITGMAFYDDIIHNRNNKFNLEYKIVNLLIDDYFKLIHDENGIFQSKEWHLNNKNSMLNEKIFKIVENMKRGIKYDIPVYDFRDGFQEGRHRLIAASILGCNFAPVALFGYNIDLELKINGIKVYNN